MWMRLISAEELKNWITKVYPRAARGFCELVDEMDTAYDVDRVIGKLKTEGFISDDVAGGRMVKILKAGGANA